MTLLQKMLAVSFVSHVLIITIFALALPNRVFPFRQIPVELAFLDKPPERIGGQRTVPLGVGARYGSSLVKVYIPYPVFRNYSGPAGFQPGAAPVQASSLSLLPSAGAVKSGVSLPIGAPDSGSGRYQPSGSAFRLTGPGSSRRILYSPAPYYPEWAKSRGVEAYIELKLWITESGGVRDVSILKSSGYPDLDRICLDTVGRWRFDAQPGQPTWAILPLRFRLI